jgi:hypothetical protein
MPSRSIRENAMRAILFTIIAAAAVVASAADGNSFAYLDEFCDPYYVHRDFPKLITPQWVGEEGVEAVVVLAIDDMRDPARYEAYLRPILDRLKKIDGRAPVSIMTCSVNPQDPQLAAWLAEGLSIECHTVDHPCPLLAGGDFAKARSTYERCVDLMSEIPGNKPVAFRMPCCDSRNTPSPRFWTEIFNRATEKGNFLTIDSSVFCVLTPRDESLPRDLVLDSGGGERFRKYIPFPSFVNTIEDYPYPYVIGGTCWEFPCIVPSDWEAQNLQQPNNPRTVEDLKAALDAVVLKQGVFNLVFHPHGWIRSDQVAELIDHADRKHGRKVKFLTFREAYDRLRANLLDGKDLGSAPGLTLADVNGDGYIDVIDGAAISMSGQSSGESQTRVWRPEERTWTETSFPAPLVLSTGHNTIALGAKFGVLGPGGAACVLLHHYYYENFARPHPDSGLWRFDGDAWARESTAGLEEKGRLLVPEMCEGTVFRDLDGDGVCELIVAPPHERGEHNVNHAPLSPRGVYSFDPQKKSWRRLPFAIPEGIALVGPLHRLPPPGRTYFPDAGVRLVDVSGDGALDLLASNPDRSALHVFASMNEGWSTKVFDSPRADDASGFTVPPLVRPDGTNNGGWLHSHHLWLQNEDTDRLPDLVDRRSFAELLAAGNRKSTPQAPSQAGGQSQK